MPRRIPPSERKAAARKEPLRDVSLEREELPEREGASGAARFVRTARFVRGGRAAGGKAAAGRFSREKAEEKPAKEGPTPVERALRLISSRARTARELSQALAKAKVKPEDQARALARMRELGYIDDASLADSRARRFIGKGDSPRMVARRLQMQGISSETAQSAAVQAAEGASEDELAARALEMRLRGRPVRDERDKARLMRALVQHGHRPSSVMKALKLQMENGDVDDGDVS